MGNYSGNNNVGHQSSQSGDYAVPDYNDGASYVTFKRSRKKVETKLILIVVDLLGITWTIKGLVTKVNNLMEAILFIILMLYALTRYYFYVKRQWRLERKEEFQQRQLEKNSE